MIYLTLTQILAKISESQLEELTEGEVVSGAFANVNSTTLDEAELAAIGEMTGYLDIRYDAKKCFDMTYAVPDVAVPPLLPLHQGYNGVPTVIQMLVDIMLYHAHARIMPDNIPTLREKRYNYALSWCEKLADGFIAPQLPTKELAPTTSLRYGNSSEKRNSYY